LLNVADLDGSPVVPTACHIVPSSTATLFNGEVTPPSGSTLCFVN